MRIRDPIIPIVAAGVIAAFSANAQEKSDSPLAPLTAELRKDGIQYATVVLDTYSFYPSHVIVKAGTPVELTLRNESTLAPHNLILSDDANGLNIKENVPAGKTRKVKFTPAKRGKFTFFCDKKLLMFPSHRAQGMEGTLEVR